MAARGGGGSVAVRCNALVAWEGGGWARREVFWVEDVTNFRSERFHKEGGLGLQVGGAMEGATTSTYPLVGKKIITQPKHTALRLLWGIGFGVSAQ